MHTWTDSAESQLPQQRHSIIPEPGPVTICVNNTIVYTASNLVLQTNKKSINTYRCVCVIKIINSSDEQLKYNSEIVNTKYQKRKP